MILPAMDATQPAAKSVRGDWSRLRLPRPLREIWQEHFPELGPG
jgi:hypothetical protein